jgi:hypothetical protein
MLLTLLMLITIFLIDSTLEKAFNSQCNKKDIFQNNSRGKQCAKEMLQRNYANFRTILLKSETHDTTSHTGIKPPLRSLGLSNFLNKTTGLSQNKDSVPNDGPASTIKQLSAPSDFPAITTSSFLQRYFPMNATIAQISATTATTNATMTQVSATRNATTNAPKHQLDKCKASQAQNKMMSLSMLHPTKKVANYATPRCLLLLLVSNGTAIMMTNPSLSLPFYQNEPAITMVTHVNFIQLIVASI